MINNNAVLSVRKMSNFLAKILSVTDRSVGNRLVGHRPIGDPDLTVLHLPKPIFLHGLPPN